MSDLNIARFYQINGQIGMTFGDSSTAYISVEQAQQISAKLAETAEQTKNGYHSETVEVAADDKQEAQIYADAPRIYSIIRFYRDDRPNKTIETGLTVYEAKDHCNDPDTSTDEYFDGFESE